MTTLKFASDKPTSKDQLGVHQHMAELLIEIVESESDNPLVVGLFGGWGTGKSTVVKMFQEKMLENRDSGYVFIDAWAYENAKERFGAGLLRKIVNSVFSCENRKRKYLEKINQKTEIVRTQLNLGRETVTLFFLIIVCFILLTIFAGWHVNQTDNVMYQSFWILIEITIASGVFGFLLPNILVSYERKDIDTSYNQVEHFQDLFVDIIKKMSYQDLVIVVDNIDRAVPSDAIEMIRVLKTFINNNLFEERGINKNISFIVPCDNKELASHIQEKLGVTDGHEFLEKFFNISLFIPSLVPQNIGRFTKDQLKEANNSSLLGLSLDQIETVSFIISRAASRSPRQVKVLINSFVVAQRSMDLLGNEHPDFSSYSMALYVCLRYLTKGGIDKIKYDIFQKISSLLRMADDEKEEIKIDDEIEEIKIDDEIETFLNSMVVYLSSITSGDWELLQRLQVSIDEREILNFTNLYDNIVDLKFKELEGVFEAVKFYDLSSRIYRRARESGRIEQIRVAQWALWKLSTGDIEYLEIPEPIREFIGFRIFDTEFLGSGLAKFLVSSDNKKGLPDFNRIFVKEYDWNEQNLTANMLSFLKVGIPEMLVNETLNTNKSRKNIDKFLSENLSIFQELPEFVFGHSEMLFDSGSVTELVKEISSTPEFLKDKNEMQINKFINNISCDAAYMYLQNWIDYRPSNLNIYEIAHNWTFLNYLLLEKMVSCNDLSVVDKHSSASNSQWQQFIGFVDGTARGLLQEGNFTEGMYGAFCLYYLYIYSKLVDESLIAAYFTNTWDAISTSIDKFSEEEIIKLEDFIKSHWQEGICQLFGDITVSHLTRLENINFLDWIYRNRPTALDLILQNLYVEPRWNDVVCKFVIETDVDELSNVATKIFGILQGQNADPAKYGEAIAWFKKKTRKTSMFKTVVSDVGQQFINATNWGDAQNIDLLITKLREIELLVKFKSEIYENVKEKLRMNGDIVSLLDTKSKEWIEKSLKNM